MWVLSSVFCILHSLSLSHTHSLPHIRLLQRYQNVKAELEAQQNLERVRMEKLAQSGGLVSVGGSKKSKGPGTASSGMKRSGSAN